MAFISHNDHLSQSIKNLCVEEEGDVNDDDEDTSRN